VAATASIAYQFDEDSGIDVEVSCDEGRPDALDEIARRAVYLLTEAIAAVNEAAAKAKSDE
jgi:hypothetical protein